MHHQTPQNAPSNQVAQRYYSNLKARHPRIYPTIDSILPSVYDGVESYWRFWRTNRVI